MVNILIADSQTREKTFPDPELKIVNYSLAQSDLFALVQEMSPEVVTIDLSVPSAFSTISRIANNFARVKILAINARSFEVIRSAIEQGASASTLEGISDEELKLVLQSLCQECVLVDSKRCDYPHFLVLPISQIAPQLETWKYWSAMIMVNYWRAAAVPFSLDREKTILELRVPYLDIYLEDRGANKISITKQLDRIVESLSQHKKHFSLMKQLNYIERVLKNWYFNRKDFTKDYKPNCVLAKIKDHTRRLEKDLLTKLKNLFCLWAKAGSYTLSEWLKLIITNLQSFEIEFQQKSEERNWQAHSAKKSYENWSAELEKNEELSSFESAVRALKLYYQDSIKAKVYSAASQIVGEMLNYLYECSNNVMLSDNLLYDFFSDLELKINDGFSSEHPLPEIVKVEIQNDIASFSEIRHLIEEQFLKRVYCWSSLSEIDTEAIRAEIIKKGRALTLRKILNQF